MNYCVITTINKPTTAVTDLYEYFEEGLIIVGDTKTPANWNHRGITQLRSNKIYAPDNHYAKKNAGYMQAIKNRAEVIYDTDDDNIPIDPWKIRSVKVEAHQSISQGWFNVYKLFTTEHIWPRGFPLKEVSSVPVCDQLINAESSIQQGIAEGDPDVDAIWRLTLKKEIEFDKQISVYLSPGAWCPFNSQSTWWFPKAYPLLYLPVYASFRMTDIWRSFVAQRCLWELGEGVTFHSPSEVFQDRNEHDLMKDFESEIPGYLNNDRIVEILGNLKLNGTVCENMTMCYFALINNNILPWKEIEPLTEWIKDYDTATNL